MGPETVYGIAGLVVGASLGVLTSGLLASGKRPYEPPTPGAPVQKPKHVHIWRRTSAEQTNRATRWVYSCYDCPAREVRELEAEG